MRAALDMFGPDEFARSFGNRWVSTTARVIPLGAWRACQDPEADLGQPGGVSLAFDVAVDRSDAAVVAAWRDDSGICHIEVADCRPGVGWLPVGSASWSTGGGQVSVWPMTPPGPPWMSRT